MKTTTISKLGAIVTGAALVGTAVAGAFASATTIPADLEAGFFYTDATPNVQIVIGEKAHPMDGAVAGQIAAVIGNLAYKTETKSETKTVSLDAKTLECKPVAPGKCPEATTTAEGKVVLSFPTTGVIGDLNQRAMNTNIYGTNGLVMTNLDDGGDSGDYCANTEQYTPKSALASISTGTGCAGALIGTGDKPLKAAEFSNEICTLCYNYCDVALTQTDHKMSEWVDLDCSRIRVIYDCDNKEFRMELASGAITYNIFLDDLLTDELKDDSDPAKLIGQEYFGKILLGQEEYYVQSIKADELVLAKGAAINGITSTQPGEYTTPTGDKYSIKLLGVNTLEDRGVVEATFEVTKPDASTVQVTTGLTAKEGTPVVGDIKLKLQRGNVVMSSTGETSSSVDILVWFEPSRITLEADEEYTSKGVKDDDGIWTVQFNGGNTITVADLDNLEENEYLYGTTPLPEDIDENDHYDGGYDEAEYANDSTRKYGNVRILRSISFSLAADLTGTSALKVGERIQLPFNDGKYLNSKLAIGFEGLMDENFIKEADSDTSVISLKRKKIDLYDAAGTEFPNYETGVEITFKDEWGNTDTYRIDEGPYSQNEKFIAGGNLYKITKIQRNTSGDGVIFRYKQLRSSGWDEDATECVLPYCVGNCSGFTVRSVLDDVENVSMEFNGTCSGLDAARVMVENQSSSPMIYLDLDEDYMIEITTNGDIIQTNYEQDLRFSAVDDVITIRGSPNAGVEDGDTPRILINMYNETFVNVTGAGSSCSDYEDGDEDGTIYGLAGAKIVIDSDSIEEPDGAQEVDMIGSLEIIVPKNQLRPTLFFGTSVTPNESIKEITEADKGKEIEISGVKVTVKDFTVTGTITTGGTPTPTEEEAAPQTLTCPTSAEASVDYQTLVRKEVSDDLVIVEKPGLSGNLVLIGGPAVNSLTKDLVNLKEGDSKIIKTGNKLVVAGYTKEDTMRAAKQLIAWLKENVKG